MKKEMIPAIIYAKTTYTPVISVGLEHMMVSVPPKETCSYRGGDATSSLVSWIMNNKFGLSLLVYRMESELARRGIPLSRQTMNNWIIRFSKDCFCQPAAHMADLLKASRCTQCDELCVAVHNLSYVQHYIT